MAGFQTLDDQGEGLIVYKPEGAKKYVLCVKTKKGVKHIAIFNNDAGTEALKDQLIKLNIIGV